MVLLSAGAFAQAVGDYGTMSSGSWNGAIWGTWNGASWNAVAGFPSSANNVWITPGKTVVCPVGGPYSCRNLTVQATGKLWTANSASNVYVYVYGTTLQCDGQIGGEQYSMESHLDLKAQQPRFPEQEFSMLHG